MPTLKKESIISSVLNSIFVHFKATHHTTIRYIQVVALNAILICTDREKPNPFKTFKFKAITTTRYITMHIIYSYAVVFL